MMLASTAQPLVPDETLADGARRGTQGAFDILVSRYQARVYRLAMRLSRNASDAEEITQETFLHAHRGMTSFHAESKFGTWLYRIAVNEALMRKRAATRRPTWSLEALDAVDGRGQRRTDGNAQPGDSVPLADDLLERKRLAERVRGALNRLDADTRAALVLRDLEELSADQAADILGISPEAVRQRAHRGRAKLRDLLYR
jgi:RNA polymerase sigma-70 factor, ECF subfamily